MAAVLRSIVVRNTPLTGLFPPAYIDRIRFVEFTSTRVVANFTAFVFSQLEQLTWSSNPPAIQIVPPSLPSCAMTRIIVSNATMTGPIPVALNDCPELQLLSLSQNSVGPRLTRSILDLPVLILLDLSYNNFSEIDSFTGTRSMFGSNFQINLSHNSFKGPITAAMLRTISTVASWWYMLDNQFECPQEPIQDSLSLWNKQGALFSGVYGHRCHSFLSHF